MFFAKFADRAIPARANTSFPLGKDMCEMVFMLLFGGLFDQS